MKLMLILGSTREGRQGAKVATWVEKRLLADTDLTVDFVDLAEIDLPFYNEPASPMMAQGNYKNEVGKAWLKRVSEADAFIMITPEYNHSFPAVLKNALDWVCYEWHYKPVGFVSYGYGTVGGSRAVEQLRGVVAELRMLQTRDQVVIPGIFQAFDEAGEPVDVGLEDQLKTVVADLKKIAAQK